ncbi:MAG: SpoIIIAH-like family protein [Bacillota bacterium]
MSGRPVTFAALGRKELLRFLVLLFLLALLAAGAVYLRTRGHGPRLGATQVPGANPPPPESTEVMAPFEPGGSLAETRMERERVRSQQIELLERMVSSRDTAPDVRTRAQEQILAIIAAMGKEVEIEGILRSKGYRDVLAYVREGAVTVVVPDPLQGPDATRIADAVCRVTGCRPEQVAIVAPVATGGSTR